MKNDSHCLFCRIALKKVPGTIIYEDDKAMALLDIHPRSPGHTFIIPKYHAENLLDLPTDMIGSVFEVVQKVAKRLVKELSADGITIGINQGRVSGQEIDHLHIHVMPRFSGDGGGSIQSVVSNAPMPAYQDEIKRRLMSNN